MDGASAPARNRVIARDESGRGVQGGASNKGKLFMRERISGKPEGEWQSGGLSQYLGHPIPSAWAPDADVGRGKRSKRIELTSTTIVLPS